MSRTGGLGGGAGSRLASDDFSFIAILPPSARMVDAEEEDVVDSRTDERPCCCLMLGSSFALCLVTGGRLCSGLACLTREVVVVDLVVDNTAPGE